MSTRRWIFGSIKTEFEILQENKISAWRYFNLWINCEIVLIETLKFCKRHISADIYSCYDPQLSFVVYLTNEQGEWFSRITRTKPGFFRIKKDSSHALLYGVIWYILYSAELKRSVVSFIWRFLAHNLVRYFHKNIGFPF